MEGTHKRKYLAAHEANSSMREEWGRLTRPGTEAKGFSDTQRNRLTIGTLMGNMVAKKTNLGQHAFMERCSRTVELSRIAQPQKNEQDTAETATIHTRLAELDVQ